MAVAAPPGMVTSVERIWLLRPFLECARKHEREKGLLDQLDECVKPLWQSPRGQAFVNLRGLDLSARPR